MTDDLVKELRRTPGWPTLGHAAADRIEELEAQLAAKACPLGDECDLAGAYMAGAEEAKDTIRQQQDRIEELYKRLEKAEKAWV